MSDSWTDLHIPHSCKEGWYLAPCKGAVRQCNECGKYWVADGWKLWRRVRWWDFHVKKVIRDWEAE